jgi:hypothetical protein
MDEVDDGLDVDAGGDVVDEPDEGADAEQARKPGRR